MKGKLSNAENSPNRPSRMAPTAGTSRIPGLGRDRKHRECSVGVDLPMAHSWLPALPWGLGGLLQELDT